MNNLVEKLRRAKDYETADRLREMLDRAKDMMRFLRIPTEREEEV